MGPFRLTPQEARTLTVLLLILLAGLMGMLMWGGDSEPEDNMVVNQHD
ncbi:hypothetical protein [Cerasicoccus arenae]|uniref:Uncharacterized protein n=1 Tax=Cerasicoccus arenae TaxID=424488 RepID=A0A8J3DK04_9BACT|nr:hypothetical protein [Cerasicoccus arenae]MBK1858376.1 hypothetical protein [Cerasicoccus arenae]GHC09891.1 hypothetical protein GCM10007047_29050 [Cerasicoccus arenae]